MIFLIQINGDVKGPFPIEKLIDEGLTKRTRVCIDGTEELVYAEDVMVLDDIWEPKKEVPLKAIENKKEETKNKIEEIKEEKTPQSENEKERKDLSENAKRRMFLMGGVFIVLFLGIYWVWGNWKNSGEDIPESSSLKEEHTSEIDTIKSLEKDKQLVKLINSQKEYIQLIEAGIIAYNTDNLPKALEKFLQAQIVKRDNSLKISNNAQATSKIAIIKGNEVFGNGQLKEVIPLAEIHYKIAQAIDPNPEVEAKIKRCQSIQ